MNVVNPVVAEQSDPLADVLEKARRQSLSLGELIHLAEALAAAGQHTRAVNLYKTWIAYNSTNALLHLVYFNYSVVLRQTGDLPGSINALRTCILIDPKFGPAHINLGRALEDAGHMDAAVELWRSYADATADVTPDRLNHRVMSLQHIGRVLEGAGRLEETETALWQAIELQPEKSESAQHWTAARQRQCKWPILKESAHVTRRQLLDAMSPMALACHADDPLFQLARAYRYGKHLIGRPDTSDFASPKARSKTGTGQRLRVGYVSSDLREHAVGFALCEVLELHDRSNVEIYAYYCGEPRTKDATQERIRAAVHCWRDIASLSDAQAAAQISADEIDILIDVNGYTKLARTKIFAYRPAPVIVNFCGYPGTMATPYHQYMIADPTIVPPENEVFYTEKVLRIACNQPVDRKRQIGPRPSRAAAGLPEDAFVFACFNGMQKITAECFARWMTILSATPRSVLWLLSGDESAQQRLHEEAEKLGVAKERILFAAKANNPNHLARIALADLFLDTFPYGAHSTGSDAITMGLPVLTVPGKSFAARFCASIVAAAGIPQMICASPEEYTSRAIGFAQNPQSLQAVRDALQAQRETCALRDIPALARRLEELFWQMQAEAERGDTPVPDLRNLDIYYEVGAQMVLADVSFEDERSYRARFFNMLAKWNNHEPLQRDTRLWNAGQ